MSFSGVNLIAILVAGFASFGFGAVWYMALARWWMAALGRAKADFEASPSPVPFIVALLAQFLMASVLAGLMGHLGAGLVNLKNGIILGAICWLGFVITTLVVNHGFQNARPMLTLIDGGHWLGVLLIQGAIIGVFGI